MSDSVGSVSVDVVPDARGWSEKLRAQIRDQSVTINADADTGEAEAQLDEVARTRTAKVKADTSQLSQGASKLDQFVGQLGLLPALALAGGAALVPLGAALAGVTAALSAPLLIAGGGATIFGFLAGFAVKDTTAKLKEIDKLHAKLDGLTKGTQEYRDAQKSLHDAQTALTPAQKQFGDSLQGVKSAFQGLLEGKNGQALLGPLTGGLTLLAHVLPGLEPLIRGVSGGLSSLLGDLSDSTKGPGFAKFIKELASRVGPDIESFGHIAGNSIRGLTGFILALDGSLSGGVLHGLETLSQKFAHLGDNADKSKGLQNFIDYFHQVGPQVARTLGSLATSFGHIVEALAPLGPPVLHIIQGIADAFNDIPIPVLTALAAATGGLVAFQKLGGFKAGKLLGNALGGKTGGTVGGILTGGVQKVFVVNMGAGGLGGGLPGSKTPGVPGVPTPGGSSFLGKLGIFGAGAAAITTLDAGGTALLKKEYGETVGTVASGIFRALAGNLPDPSIIAKQNKFYGGLAGKAAGFVGGLHAPGNIGSLFSMPATSNKPTSAPSIHLKSSTNEVDGLRASLARASRSIDQIGPHADNAFGQVVHDAHAAQAAINGIHDKKIQVIAQTAGAIASLQRLQAIRIADKSFTVYQRNQIIEQAVGPGGGAGRHNVGGSAGGGGASGGGASGRPVHIHLDDNGKRVLTGHMEEAADRVYQANGAYNDARAGL